jgi:ABC-type Mn2+/Zn2+ transport system permease subunit
MLRFLLLVLMSVTVVVSVKSVGVVLVSALLVAPAAAAAQLTRRFGALLALAACFGITSSVGGLFASVWLDIPSGASIVLTATLLFFAAWSGAALRRRTVRPAAAGPPSPPRSAS